MKPKILVWLLSGVLLALVVGLVVVSLREKSPDAVEQARQAKIEELYANLAALEQAKDNSNHEKVVEVQHGLAEAIGGRAGKMLDLAIARNLPIEMYGKVIDQHGQPVPGAKVRMVIAGGADFAPGTGLTSYTSDADGMFRVTAKGEMVQVTHVSHPDVTAYVTLDPSDGRRVQGKLLRTKDPSGDEHSWRTYNTPDSPFLIKVWRVEKFEKVERGSGYFEPVPAGKSFQAGGIVATCSRDPKEPGKHWREQTGSWSITLRPIDGGIQETNDVYLNWAPESGYLPELTVSMVRGALDYKVNIYPARRYYYTAHNGKWYGALEASFDPYMEDGVCLVKIDFKYNPNGSGNLAVRSNN